MSELAGRLAPAAFFDALLNPGASITSGYESWRVTTKDGTTYTGLLVASGNPLIF